MDLYFYLFIFFVIVVSLPLGVEPRREEFDVVELGLQGRTL